MEKTTSITLQTAGPTALIAILAQVAVKVAERYHIIIAPETAVIVIVFLSGCWIHRHTKRTAALIDVLANSEKMTVDEGKALAAIATEVQSKGLAGPITDQTVAIAKEVARVRELVPQATVQDVLERTQNR